MLRNHFFFALFILVNSYCIAMENHEDQDQHPQKAPTVTEFFRQKVVTFATPLDDSPAALANHDDQTGDPKHRPMKRPSKQLKKSHVFTESLHQQDDQSYWNRFICCLCRLAHAEFDENNFYRSLRD